MNPAQKPKQLDNDGRCHPSAKMNLAQKPQKLGNDASSRNRSGGAGASYEAQKHQQLGNDAYEGKALKGGLKEIANDEVWTQRTRQ